MVSLQPSVGAASTGEGSVDNAATAAPNANESTNNNNTKEKNAAAAAAAGGAATTGAAATPNDANSPMRQSLITIEHKIRNLEKRKTKLESYRAIQATGKELSSDQKAAVAKYDAVMATLEFARDLSKTMMQFCKDAEKDQKKQARKDNILKALAETAKIREVLIIQNILGCFSDETVRNDFLNGENGAVKLESSDLDALEKFCIDTQTHRQETTDDTPFVAGAQKAAELFSMTIDGRPKQYGETTFENLRRILNQIHECGYLDKIYLSVPEANSETVDEDFDDENGEGEETVIADENFLVEGIEKLNVLEVESENTLQQSVLISSEEEDGIEQQQPINLQQHHDYMELQSQVISPMSQTQPPSGAAAVTSYQPPMPPSGSTTPVHVGMYPPQQMQASQLQQVPPGGIINLQQGQQPTQIIGAQPTSLQRQMMTSPTAGGQLPQGTPIPLHGAPPPAGHFPPTTVRAVEQSFFKQHHHQQYLQQMRPLAEVIGTGSFYFLQDSELDSPELGGAAPMGTVIFDQHQQQTQNHAETPTTQTELHASAEQQQLIVNNMHNQQQQSQQPIPTQTFTNQSFPPLQQVQSSSAVTAVNSSNTQSLPSTTSSPMFPQKQLFSPITSLQQQQQQLLQQQQQDANVQQQLLLNEQQQPMMVMTRLAAPQVAHLASQQQSHIPPLGMQPVDAGFPFDNPVVTSLSYEQQMQQQLGATANLQSEDTKGSSDEGQNFNTESVTEWETTIKNATRTSSGSTSMGQNNAAATVALASALKPSVMETTNWSTEMNSVGASPTPSGNNTHSRKNDWNTNSGGGSYGDGGSQSTNAHETNHWNSNQQSDAGGYGRNARGPNNYQQRRGDDRRDRDDRGRHSGGGYRGRSNNYGNSGSQQHNGGRGAGNNNGGMYFRNNDSSSGGSSYYQNGGGGNGVYGSGKESGSRYDSGGGGNYRGPRGGNTNPRNNAPPPRSMGRNSGGAGGGGGGSTNSSSSSTYINPRHPNRLPMGLENKN